PFWLPSPPSDGHVLLLNRSTEVIDLSIQIRSGPRASERGMAIQPGQLRVLDLRQAGGIHGNERVGAVKVSHSGGYGDLIVRGFVLDEAHGFSSRLDFFATPPDLEDESLSDTSSVTFPTLRSGVTDKGSRISPFLILSNEMPRSVTVSAHAQFAETLSAPGSRLQLLDGLQLDPYEAVVLDLGASLSAMRQADGGEILEAGLELEYAGSPGAVTASLLSVDEVFGHVHQSKAVWPSDLNLGYSYPMLLQGGWTTKVYLTNRTSERAVFCLFIHSQGQSYTYAGAKWLEPFEFRMVDVGLLQAEQIPDEFGRVLPLTAEEGQIKLLVHSEDPSSVSGQAVLENRTLGVSIAAGCPVCPASSENLFLLTSLAGVPGAFGIPALYIGDAGLESRIYAVETFDDSNWKDVSGFAGYNSSDGGVASVDKGFLRADVEFHSAGEADIGASFLGTGWLPPTLCEFLPSGGMNCSCTETAKPLSVPGSSSSGFFSPTAEVLVLNPTLTSISPDRYVLGGSTTVTLQGTGFVEPLSVNVSGSGITATVQSVTPNSVTATFSLPGSAAAGSRSVTVTAAGATTNAKTFVAQKPTRFDAIDVFAIEDPTCAPTANQRGFFVEVEYRVLDQNGDVIEVAGMTPLEEIIRNGQNWGQGYLPFASPSTTNADGEFTDEPVGTCFGAAPPPNLCVGVIQNFKLRVPGGGGTTTFSITNQTVRTDCMLGLLLFNNGTSFSHGTVN
ncbi:MAG TPA: IPT/TIG domain-containing protein, partial [Acidobacteriota bacterium]|nr:IPT/TIG domain-containing protein [Acidobacteriota bacterium]